MKKLITLLTLAIFLIPFSISAEWMQYTTKTSSGLVYTGTGYYYGVKVNTDGTNDATVTVYDNTAASGTAIDPTTVYPTSSTMRAAASGYTPPLMFFNGLYVAITCSGTTSVTVYYAP